MSFPNPVNVESILYLRAGSANADLTEFQFDCEPVNTIEDVLASFQAAANLAAAIALGRPQAEVPCRWHEIPLPDGRYSPLSISITVRRNGERADVDAVATLAGGVSEALWNGRVDRPVRGGHGVPVAELDWFGGRTPPGRRGR